MDNFDFSGWATRNNVKCADGRTILKNAFIGNDGATVPLVWNHMHDGPENVLGHALLENRDEGVYAYCTLNDTEAGNTAKDLVKHGDISALSIYANRLKQDEGKRVIHGIIREVSLVLAGANPEAFIDSVIVHSDEAEEEAIIYSGEEGLDLEHSEKKVESPAEPTKKEEEKKVVSETETKKPETKDPEEEKDETIGDVFDTMTEKQKKAAYAVISMALENKDGEDKEASHSDNSNPAGGEEMKHNVFDNSDNQHEEDVICHSDQEKIMSMAKSSQYGTFKTALDAYMDDQAVQHGDVGGFAQTGDGNVSLLFPDYQDVRPGAPELITNDQGWISTVLAKVHKSPISRVRTSQVDIRNIDALKAKGYVKGKQKVNSGNFKLVRRTTDPQTVYVHNVLYRDDVVDITDFDYAAYLYNIDKMLLNEELAMAIVLGDGREDGDEAKISADHIRPIWTDDDLYTIHVDVDIASAKTTLQGTNTSLTFGDNYVYAEAIIEKLLYAREAYKGTGTPDFYCDPHILNVCLLARDMNGRRIYASKSELAAALNVGDIYTAEQFAGKTRTTSDSKKKKILGLMCNLADYSLGATKGGEVTHFTDFDIDFNQLKSLLETRVSGCLTRVYSAIVLEEDVTTTTTTTP